MPNFHQFQPAQRSSVIAVAIAAPIAPYCGIKIILQMILRTTATIPLIKVNIERPDMESIAST